MTCESSGAVTQRSLKEEDTHESETHAGSRSSVACEIPKLTTDPLDKPYTCLTCSRSFVTSSHLALHMCRDRKPKRTRYRCRKHACFKVFSRPSQLVHHMAIHAGQKPFKCTDCGRCFGRGSHLDIHRRLHTGEKPFECSTCGKSFTQKSGLIVHVRKHTGERPYKCDKCSEAFRTAAKLLSHQAVEAGEGRHACATCHKTYRTLSALRQHEKTHRESPDSLTHTCSVCRGTFVCTSELHESNTCVFHCSVCNVIFTDMDAFERHCQKHQTENPVYKVEEEEEEEVLLGKRKKSARDPPFRPHVATSATRYMSDISTRSKTRARNNPEGPD